MILRKKWTQVLRLYGGWERGDLQWQNSLGESLTFWASEVSLQQQALKNKDNLNWLKTTARRNELANMTVWLKAQPLCIKPRQGVVCNRNKSFILSFYFRQYTQQGFTQIQYKLFSASLPVSLKLCCFCHGNWIMLQIPFSAFVLAGYLHLLLFSLPTNSFSRGRSPLWLECLQCVWNLRGNSSSSQRNKDWELNQSLDSMLRGNTINHWATVSPLDRKIRLWKTGLQRSHDYV